MHRKSIQKDLLALESQIRKQYISSISVPNFRAYQGKRKDSKLLLFEKATLPLWY